MNRSVVSDLWYKMVHSGSRMNFFIGINTIIFLFFAVVNVVEFLFRMETGILPFLKVNLALPAFLPSLLYKFWTLFTYMFVHEDFLHFIFNMLALYWFGRIFEDFLNARQFTFTYIAGGIVGGLLFILFYNVFPGYQETLPYATVVGASACVMAIIVATATLLPDYNLHLLIFGSVQLKYLALVYILIDIIGMAGLNAGGAIAHLGGALLGFVYIKQLKAGNDWSKTFQRKPRLKVVHREKVTSRVINDIPEQEVIDRILDKISQKGYQSLTKQEKELLFKASNKNEE
ncbi:rhomboid family protein [Desertivirga arenae]|uniref:rhomboid family protein n=1 Tax=Desertivirga arenae TaxID=2810309 RepID=UPI001A9600DE|nr:rhomboid family intramembrane serine protease [Pedobacter sp. SYSU D00823]